MPKLPTPEQISEAIRKSRAAHETAHVYLMTGRIEEALKTLKEAYVEHGRAVNLLGSYLDRIKELENRGNNP